ncbi:hypothetical protein K8O89_17060 [Legionella anisa]|uniref:Uncharacterized protein n=1 Tax=Legionella anisa TaxID=28082 RepID=A0AAX0WZD2_9GAMM|nr:hypothetical protein DLD14_10030 [Legionella anisa]MBN5935180.1 hypothetical protein [Legionella anisa]PNL63519.1 hypothetical protein A6J39_012400 [Legionella anisa]UAK81397.1 hypothetical protein K8O89_17060 [Legionella anisa]
MSALCFLLCTCTSAFAFEGHGGGYHGAIPNTGYHNNGYYNNYQGSYYHNNEWYGGSINANTWNDGIWYDDNLNDDTNVVLGVPNEGYYDPSCQTIDDCSSGTCVLVNTCDQE